MGVDELLNLYYSADAELGDKAPESFSALEGALLGFCESWRPPQPLCDGVIIGVVIGLSAHPNQTGITPGFIAGKAFDIADAVEREKAKREGINHG